MSSLMSLYDVFSYGHAARRMAGKRFNQRFLKTLRCVATAKGVFMSAINVAFPQFHRDEQQVRQLLTLHGVKVTAQRLTVALALFTTPVHLSAEQLINVLKKQGEKISKATVYNALKLFVAHGLLKHIHLDSTRTVYDSICTAHHHFHDIETGQLWDIDPQMVTLSQLPELPPGMEIAAVEVMIRLTKKNAS